jgi:hypothetical protein
MHAPKNNTEAMDLIQGAKVLSERIGKQEGELIAVPVVDHSIPAGALPVFSWVGVVPPASDDAEG